jgi:vacuolar protein sorting-associated protein 45
LALNADFFTLNMTLPSWPIFGDSPHIWDGRAFQRCVEGLLSMLLSLKKRPLVRYEKNSTVAKRLAAEVHVRTLS